MQMALEFCWRDCWIGVFWKVEAFGGYHRYLGLLERRLDVWICLVPMLPIHLTWFLEENKPLNREEA